MRGAICFVFSAICLLLFLTLLAGRHSDSTLDKYYCCLFPLLCVFLSIYRLISAYILVERGMGRNEHGAAVVEWISACVVLVSACSSSWYILFNLLCVSFGLLSTCVTTG